MPMKQFTIELRVDYADEGKNAVMKTAMAQAARHVLATATLLGDGQVPTVAVFSEDFFIGKEDINLMLDAVAEGKRDMKPDDDKVSQELLDAFADTQKA